MLSMILDPTQNFELDEDDDIDLDKLPPEEREAIMAHVTPDDSLPTDAFSLGQNDLRRELIDRGIQPKGFFNDDATRLQEEFDREHVAEKESRMRQKIQMAAKSYLRETIKRKRQQLETELREELDELAENPKLEVWLDLVKSNTTPQEALLRVNSIATRALSKVLPFNLSLRALNLSGNQLNDMAGKALANILRRNNTLVKLDVENNDFGPATAKEFAAALTLNSGLTFLSLESNPLTADENDFSGIAAIGAMLTKNNTLTSLNLWRTRLGIDGGKALAKGLQGNKTMLCLDIGNNKIALADAAAISTTLADNLARYDALQQKKSEMKKGQKEAAERVRKQHEEECKQKEHEQWLEERRIERQTERDRIEAERQRKLKEEEDRQRQISDRKAAERAAKLELEKKKKKKGGKKKKK
ncbi:unnamed protein product [Aphanomyces euteiches]|uniref:Uncharacterized protein n=1 Tax=Aphanomyces euteiches TaxID=100861 RepID=A0A6G0XP15_9STRA|nr:hypothetical protein Ae201684_002874 [Aphanomyces euteiches]KAH9093244.1 hypothetical protein Ae201684P_008903 [Aphanomyces euteiches]KAH9155212.1 hypothetical protein AeRB84_002817 [Aphanomyces euteiches]